jgi:hypothetical protein
MMTVPVPTLSTDGWVVDTAKRVDILLANAWICEACQSDDYRGSITSIADVFAQVGSNLDSLPALAEEVLTRYLTRYFDSITVKVSLVEALDGGSLTTVAVSIGVYEKNDTYTFDYIFKNEGSKLVEYLKVSQ